MLTKQRSSRSSRLGLLIGLAGVGVGLATGFLIGGTNPLYLGLALGAIPFLFYFFTKFEQAVMGLLILRGSLDAFSGQQIPAAFAIALDFLTLLYVTVKLLTGQPVRVDNFWWFFAGWVILQGLWVILLPLGGVGLDASFLPESIREWVRLFSWAMVYLLVMQLKDKLSPEKVISGLFLSLVIPITVALMQMFLPSLLPPMLSVGGGDLGSMVSDAGSRIRGTFGVANTFATFVLLFIGLTWWKVKWVQHRLSWLVLLGLLAFFFVSTKSLFSLIMLAVFVVVLIAPKLSFLNLIGGIFLFMLVIALFASTEFGQQRLSSIANTPLLNPDIDISRAILLSYGDHNSFNWRLSQWNLLLNRWQQFPVLGYGLGLSIQAGGNGFLPHNDYIRALIEGGIVGFVTYIAFFVAQAVHLVQLMRSAPRKSRQRDLCLTLLAILASIPVGMITENIWSHTTLFFYWWTLFAVVGWNWNEQQTEEKFAMKQPQFKSG
ncbi:O-antigen ligase family protein [Mastigocladopsis repens]|uniref:O-antigen ligase family protein n=1 Tax=Mastigocladopsis repens TaxID=221287 RepID=UPI0002E8D3B9|nr:O-antigen ligase family protein [Mastigocladopsis repens]